MPTYVVIVDIFGLLAAFIGFNMVFRQEFVRRLWNRSDDRHAPRPTGKDDPITYILRIAGTMLMVFGLAIGSMITMFFLAQR